MKHSVKITSLLLLFFLLSQILGLSLISLSSDQELIVHDGQEYVQVNYEETALGERPTFNEEYGAVIYLLIGVAFGTLILLGLMKLKMGGKLWKYWYFLAIAFAMTIAFGVFLPSSIALLLGLILAFLKIRKPTFWLHNITELFMYAGLGVLLAPMFTVIWATVLLVIISLYDMYAVWKSKHMIRLAKFTVKNKLFAGILVQYKQTKNKIKLVTSKPHSQKKIDIDKISKPKKQGTIKQALLGGGDIVFPLIFAGAVFTQLLKQGFPNTVALFSALTISVTTMISLYLLFLLGKKDRFYPAMPFVSAGCFIGYFVVQALLFLF